MILKKEILRDVHDEGSSGVQHLVRKWAGVARLLEGYQHGLVGVRIYDGLAKYYITRYGRTFLG